MVQSRRFIVFLALLLLFSTFVATVHHHDDGADHSDCPVCIVSHHQPAIGQSAVALNDALFFIEAKLVLSSPVFTDDIFVAFLNNRAPPV